MSNKVVNLLNEGKIDLYQYDVYVLYEVNEMGRTFLKNKMEANAREEPQHDRPNSYAWYDGRRSCWREIDAIVSFVKYLVEKQE